MVALFLGFRPVLWRGSMAADAWLDGLGLVVALTGQGLRAAVIGYAYIKRGGVNKRIHADQLVTEGLFAHARNPLYVGNLLILAGLFIIHNHPAVYMLGGLYFVSAYIAIVAAEERFLSDKFGGAYDDYCRRVPRWLPDLRGLRDTLGRMEDAARLPGAGTGRRPDTGFCRGARVEETPFVARGCLSYAFSGLPSRPPSPWSGGWGTSATCGRRSKHTCRLLPARRRPP